ncbi:MAG TPA: SUF system NifU family Fe-S cluster assembly protein [Bacteroidota bacterium]|nr:SUF system NifU family Fe-S cluster assembly protein [Bacteroidota bacterium]
MSALNELYQEVILDHNKSPRNFRRMHDANRKVEGYNPLCGDHFTLYLKVENDIIKDISFEGQGCAISKASASVMSATVKGKTKKEAEELFKSFHNLVTGQLNGIAELNTFGKLAAFSGVSEFPARVKCASLAWHTLKAALEAKEEVVSTE